MLIVPRKVCCVKCFFEIIINLFHRRRSLIAVALRMFSLSAELINTSSGAVLCDQSMKPTYPVALEHFTQVSVSGIHSNRNSPISFPHSVQCFNNAILS